MHGAGRTRRDLPGRGLAGTAAGDDARGSMRRRGAGCRVRAVGGAAAGDAGAGRGVSRGHHGGLAASRSWSGCPSRGARSAYPVAVGACAAAHGLPLAETAQAFAQAFAANLVSAGVRLIPLGQSDGLRVLAAARAADPALVAGGARRAPRRRRRRGDRGRHRLHAARDAVHAAVPVMIARSRLLLSAVVYVIAVLHADWGLGGALAGSQRRERLAKAAVGTPGITRMPAIASCFVGGGAARGGRVLAAVRRRPAARGVAALADAAGRRRDRRGVCRHAGVAGYTSAWRRRFSEEPFATLDRRRLLAAVPAARRGLRSPSSSWEPST